MKASAILLIISVLSVVTAQAGTKLDLPQPITVTNRISAVNLAPVSVDEATGTYTVTATYERRGQLATTNGVTVAAQSRLHITVSVSAAEQVAWLRTHGMPEISAATYPDTPIAPRLKNRMITAIALAKALPVIRAALKE